MTMKVLNTVNGMEATVLPMTDKSEPAFYAIAIRDIDGTLYHYCSSRDSAEMKTHVELIDTAGWPTLGVLCVAEDGSRWFIMGGHDDMPFTKVDEVKALPGSDKPHTQEEVW